MERRGIGDERLAAICQVIRNETLELAQQEADTIKASAERDATRIRAEAKQQADRMLQELRTKLREEREAFDASLEQASKQVIGIIKERIEKALFNPELDHYLTEEFSSERKTAKLLDLLIEELHKEGLEADVSVWLGKNLSKKEVVDHLGKTALTHLPKEGLYVGNQPYGFVLQVKAKHLSIEITPESLRELMAGFIRSDFRKFFFSE
jgi:V/A-type H+-transporting ATPase subunit E